MAALPTTAQLPNASSSLSNSKRSVTFHDFCELTEGIHRQCYIAATAATASSVANKEGGGGGMVRSSFNSSAFTDHITGEILLEEEEEEEDEGIVDSSPPFQTMASKAKSLSPAIIDVDEEEAKAHHIHAKSKAKWKRGRSGRSDSDPPSNNTTFSSWLQIFLSRKRHRNQGPHHRHHFGEEFSTTGVSTLQPHVAGGIRPSVSLSVVHEATALGSDGESVEVSPSSSDAQKSTPSPYYPGGHYCSNSSAVLGGGAQPQLEHYVPNVKLRQKAGGNRRWSEQDIQKRLSLPADIKLPQSVVDKLNRTPTFDKPLTRKSRRASLSEIGFGKLETYRKIFDLGEGTYATVYLGKSLLTGKSVALKEIRLEHEEGAPCTAIREVSLLRNLKHANVVTLHDIIYTNRVLTLVFEFVEHDLREYMEEIEGYICMNNVRLFLVQLLRGLAYCHKRRILHRDLKPQNLLINSMGELKLADFGLARAQSVPTKTYSNEVVTLWYRPPDVLLGSTDYSTHIDMWGVGCILWEMLSHKPMFPGSTTDEQLNLIFQRLGTPMPESHPSMCTLPHYKSGLFRMHPARSLLHPPRINHERAELLHHMLKYDGRSRIGAAEAMRHPMLRSFPEELFTLADTESVLSLAGVSFVNELRSQQSQSAAGARRSQKSDGLND